MPWNKSDLERTSKISQIEIRTRSLVSRMAVNCRSCLDEIETISRWNKNPQIVEWHQLLRITQKVLLTKPIEPAEAPPACSDVSDIDAKSGPAGGGVGSRGGVQAPTVDDSLVPWDDVCGTK